jgi:hypothetical protein
MNNKRLELSLREAKGGQPLTFEWNGSLDAHSDVESSLLQGWLLE